MANYPLFYGGTMKFTISDCVTRINQALNYPALTYVDVYHFFDQAVSELNTSLRINIPTFTEMIAEHTFNISELFNTVVIPADITSKTFFANGAVITTIPSDGLSAPTNDDPAVVKYYAASNYVERTFYIYKNGLWTPTDEVYGITENGDAYVAIAVGDDAVWRTTSFERQKEFSLTEYLPVDWLILFIIPYVCFKFSVRNGDNGALFSDEFTQGFQQLQTSYNVSNTVTLSTVAHLPAYRSKTAENLSNLNIRIPTRAITEDMRIGNSVKAIYGGGLFDNGGWGI